LNNLLETITLFNSMVSKLNTGVGYGALANPSDDRRLYSISLVGGIGCDILL